jgi:hypothetical protein
MWRAIEYIFLDLIMYELLAYLKVWHGTESETLLGGGGGHGMYHAQGEHKCMQTFSHETSKEETTCKT